MMIVNNVFLKLNEQGNIEYVTEQLLSMRGKIPTLSDITVGKCVRGTDFDIVFATYFHTIDDLGAYLLDSMHVEVSKSIGPMIVHQVSACCELQHREGLSFKTKTPDGVEMYFAAVNTNDVSELSKCMSKNVRINNVGEASCLEGLGNVEKWFGGGNEQYQLRSEIKTMEIEDGRPFIIAESGGNFASSPQLFSYRFTVENGLISNMKITPVD